MSHNQFHRHKTRFAALLAAGLATGLTGCQVQPLYSAGSSSATASVDSGSVAAKLASVEVEPAVGRVELEARNALIFGLTGGGGLTDNRYTLQYRIQTTVANVGFDPNLSRQTADQVTGFASFRLVETATGIRVFQGKSTALASYDRSNQRFANIRALRDAEDRVAQQIAEDIRTKLATYFASES